MVSLTVSPPSVTQTTGGPSFVQRLISVTFTLTQPPVPAAPVTFPGTTSDTVTLSGLRCSAKIVNAGAPSGSHLSLSVYGLPLEMMNRLATLGMVVQLVPRNVVVVQAGDAASGLTTVFQGTILQAWGDFGAAPEVPFRVEANSGIAELVAPVPASSYQGSADVVTILNNLVSQMPGWTFENNGVIGVKVSNPYLPGSALQQARKIKDAVANVMGYDDSDNTISIWPKGSTRGGLVPTISPQTGMVGYPTFVPQGIQVTTIFNPSVKFMGSIQVQGSQLTQANGKWGVFSLDHDLESMLPHGNWKTTIGAYNQMYPAPLNQRQ